MADEDYVTLRRTMFHYKWLCHESENKFKDKSHLSASRQLPSTQTFATKKAIKNYYKDMSCMQKMESSVILLAIFLSIGSKWNADL